MTQAAVQAQPNDQPFAGRRIFISYSHRDRDFAFRLADALESNGAIPWVDKEGIGAGGEFSEVIAQAIDDHDEFLIILTPDSVSSRYVKKELHRAFRKGKGLLSVLHKTIVDRPMLLEDIHDVDFTGDFDDGFDDLKRRTPVVHPWYVRFIRYILPSRLVRLITGEAFVLALALYIVWWLIPSRTSATVLDTPANREYVSLQLENKGGRPATLEHGFWLRFRELPVCDQELEPVGSPPDVIPGHSTRTIRLTSPSGLEGRMFNGSIATPETVQQLLSDEIVLEYRLRESWPWTDRQPKRETEPFPAARIGGFIDENIPRITQRSSHVD